MTKEKYYSCRISTWTAQLSLLKFSPRHLMKKLTVKIKFLIP